MKLSRTLCKILSTAVFAAIIGMGSSVANATTWYVNASIGSDSNTGQTDTAGSNGPWATISHAASVVTAAGDTVMVEPGTYTTTATSGGNVSVTNGGSSTGGYITYESATAGQAIVMCPQCDWSSSAGFWVSASWVHIEGFTVTESQPLEDDDNGVGIQLGPAFATNNLGPHHDWVSNCTVYDCGAAGIATAYGDYWTIENNTVYGCDSTCPYAESGIDEVCDANAPGDTNTGIHNIIESNISYDNVIIPADGGGSDLGDTDGEGIIIDSDNITTSQTEYAPAHSPYLSQILIEDNLCYSNGGRGIQTGPNTNNVSVINNTCYENNTDNNDTTTERGELAQQLSYYCTWANNIAYTDSAINADNTGIMWADGGTSSPDSTYVNNLTYDVNNPTSQSVAGDPQFVAYLTALPLANILGANPVFVTPGSNFQLQSTSPAINDGSSAYTQPSTDLAGNNRVVGAAVDIGAYEYQGTTYAIPTLASITPTSASEGASQLTLSATGTNFLSTSVLQWNNASLSTTYVSSTNLTATLPAADLAWGGIDSVNVFTPAGGRSSAQLFQVASSDTAQYNFEGGVQGWYSGGAPITSVTTATTEAYAGMHALAINVSGETSSSYVTAYVNTPSTPDGATVTFHVWIPSGMPLDWLQVGSVDGSGYTWNTDYVTSLTAGAWNTLSVTIPATAGTIDSLVVQWTTTGSFTGTVYVDSISWPVSTPTLTSISPSSLTAGSSQTTLTATGTNYTSASEVEWNAVPLATTYVSSTDLTAVIPSSDLATAGADTVTVTTPSNGTSGLKTFTVNPATPTVSSFTPTHGTTSTSVAITGTYFTGATAVKFHGTSATYTVNSSSSITATVPSGASTGTIAVTTSAGTGTSSISFYDDPAEFNFESGVQGWSGSGSGISSVVQSSSEAYAGLDSLEVELSGETSSETPEVTVSSSLPTAGKTVTFHIWIPSGMPLEWIDVASSDQNGYNASNIASWSTGAWTTATLAIPSNAGTVYSLVVQWQTTATYTGDIYVDSVSW